jgi:hypothetical protein
MLEGDDAAAAETASEVFDDPRVTQFWDPQRLAGRAAAASLGRDGLVAWDVYMLFDAGPTWDDALPAPERWAHQLGDESWGHADHFHWEGDLESTLRSMFRALA